MKVAQEGVGVNFGGKGGGDPFSARRKGGGVGSALERGRDLLLWNVRETGQPRDERVDEWLSCTKGG